MINQLSPKEYELLSKCLYDCEIVMQDELLRRKTNVVDLYETVVEEINHQTDSYLEIIYQDPLILKPLA